MSARLADISRKTATLERSLSPQRSSHQGQTVIRKAPRPNPDIIHTGPYRGLPKRRDTDRSRYLTIDQITEAANAYSYASYFSLPINAQLTIAWRHSPLFNETEWPQFQTKLLDKLTRYLKHRKIKIAFVWSRERETGKGPHTHIAIHLGRRPIQIAPGLRSYLTDAFDLGTEGVNIVMGQYGANTPSMRAGIMRYLLKGMDHTAFRYTGIGADTENIANKIGIGHRGGQGIIKIKRVGASQSISRSARKRAGWTDVRDLVGLNRLLNPVSSKDA